MVYVSEISISNTGYKIVKCENGCFILNGVVKYKIVGNLRTTEQERIESNDRVISYGLEIKCTLCLVKNEGFHSVGSSS